MVDTLNFSTLSTAMNYLNCRRCSWGLLVLLAAFVISCSSQPSLVGTWEADPEQNNFAASTFQFTEDQKFFFDETEGTWSINQAGQLVISFPGVLPNNYNFSFEDGKLILRDQMGIAGAFTRK